MFSRNASSEAENKLPRPRRPLCQVAPSGTATSSRRVLLRHRSLVMSFSDEAGSHRVVGGCCSLEKPARAQAPLAKPISPAFEAAVCLTRHCLSRTDDLKLTSLMMLADTLLQFGFDCHLRSAATVAVKDRSPSRYPSHPVHASINSLCVISSTYASTGRAAPQHP